jgi:hypothetical protein
MSDLQPAADRAAKSGLSNTSPAGATATTCPAAKEPKPNTYEECTLKELVLEVDDGAGKSKVVTLSAPRRCESPAKTVHEPYQQSLGSHDLVMEVLVSTLLARVQEAEDTPHLSVKAQAFNHASHVTLQPPHPRTSIGALATTHGGAKALAQIDLPPRQGMLQNWVSIWPFSEARTRPHDVKGQACGVVRAGSKTQAVAELSILLVAKPAEEWKITLEADKAYGRSKEKWRNLIERSGEKGASVFGATQTKVTIERGAANSTTTIASKRGADFFSASTERENKDGSKSSASITSIGDAYRKTAQSQTDEHGSGFSREETLRNGEYEEKVGLSYEREIAGGIGTQAYAVSSQDATDQIGGPTFEKEQTKIDFDDALTITLKSGGQEASVNPGEVLNTIQKIPELIKDLAKVFAYAPIGWKWGFDYAFLEGSLNMAWGLRWPAAYAEENRVYYVERFVKASGEVTLASGKFYGSVGLNFDHGWLPAGVVAEIKITFTASLSISPAIDFKKTNPTGGMTSLSREVEAEFPVTATGEAIGSARCFGYSMALRGALEGKFENSAKMIFSLDEPPQFIVQSQFSGLTLTGYFHNSERVPTTVAMRPRKLLGEYEIYPETNLWK